MEMPLLQFSLRSGCLILNYGLDCIVLDSHYFNVMSNSHGIMRFDGYLVIENITLLVN